MRCAVVDVGSNSVLLVVAERQDGRWLTFAETSEVTGLGEGTNNTGILGEPGIDRTLWALREAFDRAQALGAERVVAAATMAARIASNTPQFLRRAEAQGTPVVVISGEEEARLGFEAVADDPAFSGYGRLSVIDVGGHSTELVTADRRDGHWEVRHRRSYPIGALALRGGPLSQEAPDSRSILFATRQIDDAIGLCYLPAQSGHPVAMGATPTNLVTIRERMARWEPHKVHAARLDYEEVSRAAGWLMAMTDAQRAATPGLERGRERTIHLGALILERFLFALRAEGCSVSVRGWRHALLKRLLEGSAPDFLAAVR